MKTHIEINELVNKIDNLELPLSINRLSCYAADADGGCANDAAIDRAIADGTLKIYLDTLQHRCFSFADECERDNQLDEILAKIRSMPEVASVEWVGTIDSDEGKGRAFKITLK